MQTMFGDFTKPRMARIKEYLDNIGQGDPEDIGLNQVERSLIVPRFQYYMVALDLCQSELEEVQNCVDEKGPWRCIPERLAFKSCLVSDINLESYKKKCVQDFIELRTKYRLTKDEKYLDEIRLRVLSPQPLHYYL